MHGAGTTGSAGNNPAFPAQWVYGCSVLSQGTGLLAPVIDIVADQDTSVGVSGPHGLTVRETTFVRTSIEMLRRPAATAPRRNVP